MSSDANRGLRSRSWVSRWSGCGSDYFWFVDSATAIVDRAFRGRIAFGIVGASTVQGSFDCGCSLRLAQRTILVLGDSAGAEVKILVPSTRSQPCSGARARLGQGIRRRV
jgi:hypothetical protein